MANTDTGYRRLPALGNTQEGTTATLRLAPGTYTWSVQAIDTAWDGGSFASQGSFTVPPFTDMGTLGLPSVTYSSVA